MFVRYANLNGAQTRYYEAERGHPVLLIHGVGSTADVWTRNIEALAASFRVIAPDLLGHGLTDVGAYTAGPPQPAMVEHIPALVDHLGVDRLSICGSSYGAMIALFTYFRLKDRVDRIVLLSSASATLAPPERLRAVEIAYANALAAYEEPSLETSLGRMRKQFHDASRIPRDIALIQLSLFSRPEMRARFENFMRGLMEPEANSRWRVDDRFGEIAVPLLLLWGEHDRTVDSARARDLAAEASEA